MTNTSVEFNYLRPCGMFPDGLWFPKPLTPILRMHGLITQAYDDTGAQSREEWADQFWFSVPRGEDDEEKAAARLISMVEKAYDKHGYPVGSNVTGYNLHTQQFVTGKVEAVQVSDLEPGVVYLTVVNKSDGQRVTIANSRVQPIRPA